MSPAPKKQKSRRKAVFCCSFFVRAIEGAGHRTDTVGLELDVWPRYDGE